MMGTTRFADLELSRLMLGTAQLGMPYGIANKLGQPSYETARGIIAAAYEAGVNCLDTAAAYGTSEEVIGRALADIGIADRMTVVTKVRAVESGLSASEADAIVENSVTTSLSRLKLGALPICLFHLEANFLEYAGSLARLRDRGLVRHIGASVTTPGPAVEIARSGLAEAMQVPTSILDQRYPRLHVFEDAARRGTAVFVRSIYLQGLLLMPEEEILPELAEVIPVRRRLESIAREAGVSLAELAVRWLLGMPEASSLVIGVESVGQVRENAALFAKGPLDPATCKAVADAVPDLPEAILWPTLWPKRIPNTQH